MTDSANTSSLAPLDSVMDSIIAIIGQETELVRTGRLAEAALLEPAKTDLARQYMAYAGLLKTDPARRHAGSPDADRLRRQHVEFQALLQMNLTVLATAHAVSEGILRGVSDELARKSAPSTYGASGRPNNPRPGSSQPLAVSRVL